MVPDYQQVAGLYIANPENVNIYDNSERLIEKFTILQQKIYAGIMK